jgi:hypothetical protein
LGHWILPCYSQFSFGTRFETYGPFISLILNFLGGHGKPWLTETVDTESVDKGAHQYLQIKKSLHARRLGSLVSVFKGYQV